MLPQIERDLTALLHRLSSCGIETGCGRIPELVEYLRDYNAIPADEQRDAVLSLTLEEALVWFQRVCDASELAFLARSPLTSSLEIERCRAKLEKIVGGTTSIYTETTSSNEARNTQFELVICALLRRAGLIAEPDLTGEDPDVRVLLDDSRIELQCKRPFSSPKNSLRAARRQLTTHGAVLGMYALDLTRVFLRRQLENTGGLPVFFVATKEETQECWDTFIKELCGNGDFGRQFQKCSESDNVSGGILYAYFPSFRAADRMALFRAFNLEKHTNDQARLGRIQKIGKALGRIFEEAV